MLLVFVTLCRRFEISATSIIENFEKVLLRVILKRRVSTEGKAKKILVRCPGRNTEPSYLWATSETRLRVDSNFLRNGTISIRSAGFNSKNAWAYSWKQRWVFQRQPTEGGRRKVAKSRASNRSGFPTFIEHRLLSRRQFYPRPSPPTICLFFYQTLRGHSTSWEAENRERNDRNESPTPQIEYPLRNRLFFIFQVRKYDREEEIAKFAAKPRVNGRGLSVSSPGKFSVFCFDGSGWGFLNLCATKDDLITVCL